MGKMAQAETKNFLREKRTRREFFKITGKGVAGVAVSMSVLNLFGYDKAGAATGYATAIGVLFAERQRCVGCQRCELVCSIQNDGKASNYLARVKVLRNYAWGTDDISNLQLKRSNADASNDGLFGNFVMNPETCRQCVDAACVNNCPMKAISPVPGTGTRVIDTTKCIGCGICHEKCPWHMPTVDPEKKKSTKCILCGRCAELCPAGAIKVVPWKQITIALTQSVIDKHTSSVLA